MRRYRIKALTDNNVVLTDRATGITTEYWCPNGGGYVREIDEDHPGTLGRQVCDGLLPRGSTLSCGPGGLLNAIRAEARVAYRDGRAEEMQLEADCDELVEEYERENGE